MAPLRPRTLRRGYRGKLARTPLWRPLLALLACCLLWAADPVAAQERTPTPTAQELWDAYPLEASPTPTLTPAESPAAQERQLTAPAAGSDTGGSQLLPLLAGLALALGALALLWTFRASLPRPKLNRPALPRLVSPATPAPRSANGTTGAGMRQAVRRPAAPKPAAQKPVARPRRAETLLLSAAERPTAAGEQRANPPGSPLPPDPQRAWSAEIEWIGAGNESRFAVIARTGQQAEPQSVAESSPLEWPPTSTAGVQALTDAVAELERELLAAGWAALEPGAGWYAKRFGWKPVIVVEPAPPAVELAAVRAAAPPAPAAPAVPDRPPARAGRFVRKPDWPEGSDRLWRCELRWEAGVVNSRFEAVAYEPGVAQRTRSVASSVTFKWLMMAEPNPSADEYRKELRRLVTALQGAGWDYVGRGTKWYAARFVWRRAGAPPERLDAPALEAPRVP